MKTIKRFIQRIEKPGEKALALLLFLGLMFLIFPIPTRKDQIGIYNPISRMIWCRTEAGCLHEIGHKLDHDARWISDSPEFCVALQEFLIVELAKEEPSKVAYDILIHAGAFNGHSGFPSTPNREIYAWLFAWAGGERDNMPEVFRSFYDWELAEKFKARYSIED